MLAIFSAMFLLATLASRAGLLALLLNRLNVTANLLNLGRCQNSRDIGIDLSQNLLIFSFLSSRKLHGRGTTLLECSFLSWSQKCNDLSIGAVVDSHDPGFLSRREIDALPNRVGGSRAGRSTWRSARRSCGYRLAPGRCGERRSGGQTDGQKAE
jgi:hypothetical protein